MEYRIEDHHNGYIKIVIHGPLVKDKILPVMSELLCHPEYPVKNSLWDLRGATMNLSFEDLKEIVGIMKLYKPKTKKFANKSALLVSGKLEIALANLFVLIAKFLPFDYRAFTSLSEAEVFSSKLSD